MTTPRPPRSTPPRRTPKVAGRVPTRPTTAPAPEVPVPPQQTSSEEVASEPVAADTVTPARKSRFSRKSATAESTSAAVPVSPAVEQTPPVDGSAADADTSAADKDSSVADASAADASTETPTEADSGQPDTTSLTKPGPALGDGPRGKNRPTTKVSTLKPQPTRPVAAAPVPAGEPGRSGRRMRFGWKPVGIVTAVAVVFAIVAVVAATKPGVSLDSNEAFVNSAVTSEVTSQANSRVCTIFGVQYDKLDQWQQTAQANVTGTAAQRFGEYNKAVRDALVQAGLTSGGVDCRVDSVGVKSIEGDSAVLVVNLILSQTQDQQASGSGTKRYQVSMRQVGGKWLISNFADF